PSVLPSSSLLIPSTLIKMDHEITDDELMQIDADNFSQRSRTSTASDSGGISGHPSTGTDSTSDSPSHSPTAPSILTVASAASTPEPPSTPINDSNPVMHHEHSPDPNLAPSHLVQGTTP